MLLMKMFHVFMLKLTTNVDFTTSKIVEVVQVHLFASLKKQSSNMYEIHYLGTYNRNGLKSVPHRP